MIIGHIGVAFAARWRWPRIPLGALLLATFGPDLLRELLTASGLPPSQANFYAHALPWSAFLAVAAGALAWAALRDRTTGLVVSCLVLSHIVLDMVSGNKPLWSNGPQGIDLQHAEQVELIIETAILLVGWHLLRRMGKPRWAMHWSLPALLIAVQTVSLLGSISQRPYATRCLASPIGACADGSWITNRWETTPFW